MRLIKGQLRPQFARELHSSTAGSRFVAALCLKPACISRWRRAEMIQR